MTTTFEENYMYVDPAKTILTDVDGVLLDWVYSFRGWMDRHGYKIVDPHEYRMDKAYGLTDEEGKRLCRMFNESATIRKLSPLRDAVKYVRKLHEDHGYVFRVISSLSEDTYAGHLRTKNLNELFGPTVFESYVYIDTGADKDEVLEPYRDSGCYWIEDKPENADLGDKLGLESILMRHPFNATYVGPAQRVMNWKEIYDIIVGS
jgi:fido (protein-threonine AMPylation protein)